jgi:hypothetical protein
VAKKALLVCGKHEVEWEMLRNAFEVLQLANPVLLGSQTIPVVGLYNGFRDMIERVQRGKNIKRLEALNGAGTGLGSVHDSLSPAAEHMFFRSLRTLCTRRSKYPEDRIFALYGIFGELDVTLPDPDYSQAVSDIFREASAAIITQKDSLTLLLLANGAHVIRGLPSWAVDWSFSSPDTSPTVFPERDIWCASGAWTSHFQFSPQLTELTVSGIIIDRINSSARGLPLHAAHGLVGAIYGVRTLKSWLNLTLALNTTRATETPPKLLTRVLVEPHYTSYTKTSDPEYDEEMFLELAAILLDRAPCHEDELAVVDISSMTQELNSNWPKNLDSDNEFHQFPTEKEIRQVVHLRNHENITNYFFKCQFAAIGTSLFTTRQGRMGSARYLPRSGDCVVIIAGVQFPLLLRPVEGDYTLLSTAFVTGVMSGETCPKDTDWEQIKLV